MLKIITLLLITLTASSTILADSRKALCDNKATFMAMGYLKPNNTDQMLLAMTGAKLSNAERSAMTEVVFNVLTGKKFRMAGLVNEQGNIYSKSQITKLAFKNCMAAKQS